MYRKSFFVVLLIGICPCLFAAHPFPQDTLAEVNASKDVVDIEVRLSKKSVSAGADFRAAIILHIAEGWHINAHQPGKDYLLGTMMSMQKKKGFMLVDTRYPKSRKLHFGFADEAIAVYEGKAPVVATFSVSDSLMPGRYALHGSMRVQACKDQICLAPSTIGFKLPVQLASDCKWDGRQ